MYWVRYLETRELRFGIFYLTWLMEYAVVQSNVQHPHTSTTVQDDACFVDMFGRII